jgi:predicted metal-binding membrane protein
MDRAPTDPISLHRNVILGLLLALAAAAWAVLVWYGAGADMDMAMQSPTMGLRAPLFLAIWITMMVAMMFPTAAPMIVIFHKLQVGKRQRGEAFVSTWIFVSAYLLVWGWRALPLMPARSPPRRLPCALRCRRPPRPASEGWCWSRLASTSSRL